MKTLVATFLMPQVEAESWVARHNNLPFEAPCHECGAVKRTTIPIASGRLRGLAAEPCGCGDTSLTYCVVSVDGDILTELEVVE